MRSPHIIISKLLLVFLLSLILQTHQRTIDKTHRISSKAQHVTTMARHGSNVAVTSPEERFRVRRPMTTWRKGKMFSDSVHQVPSGPNPISNRSLMGTPLVCKFGVQISKGDNFEHIERLVRASLKVDNDIPVVLAYMWPEWMLVPRLQKLDTRVVEEVKLMLVKESCPEITLYDSNIVVKDRD